MAIALNMGLIGAWIGMVVDLFFLGLFGEAALQGRPMETD